MKRLLISAAASALVASSALAADLPTRKAPPISPVAVAPVFTWTGFYVGVNAGYGLQPGKLRTDHHNAANADDHDSTFEDRTGKARGGFIGGGQAGYNYQIGQAVVGLEADINYANLGAKSRASSHAGPFAPEDSRADYAQKSLGWYSTLRPRIGFAPIERLMVYATGGLALGSVRNGSGFSAVAHDADERKDYRGNRSKIRGGWTLGAGLEYAVTSNLSFKTEYAYVDFGAKKDRTKHAPGDVSAAGPRNDFKMHTVRVGLNYRF